MGENFGKQQAKLQKKLWQIYAQQLADKTLANCKFAIAFLCQFFHHMV